MLSSSTPRSGVRLTAYLESRVYVIRGQKVLLDADLAALYQVPLKTLLNAARKNSSRFPEDFMFQLLPAEVASVDLSRQGRRILPFVFTEQGTAMLSCVLSSNMAVEVSLAIMHAFVRSRQGRGQTLQPEAQDAQIEYVFSTIEDLIALAPGSERRGPSAFAARAGAAVNEY